MAAFAGSIYYTQFGIVSPSAVGVSASTLVLLWVVLGGRGTLLGPIAGAIALPHLTNTLSSGGLLDIWLVIVGAILGTLVGLVLTGWPGWAVIPLALLAGRASELTMDLDTGIVTTTFTVDGVIFTREVFSSAVDNVLVIEDGYPLVESMVRGLFGIQGVEIRGRMTGEIPRTGELTPDVVREALGLIPGAVPETE